VESEVARILSIAHGKKMPADAAPFAIERPEPADSATAKQRQTSSREEPPSLNSFCTCASVRQAARAVTQFFEEVLSPSGVTISQFIILRTIHQLAPVSQCRLSEKMVIATETLSRRLALMRRLGWLEIQPGRNRRERLYRLTESGKKKFENALPFCARAQKRLEKTMGRENLLRVQHALDLLTETAQKAVWAKISNVA
jgi:DNA-binding MarR family transcriptional regulator